MPSTPFVNSSIRSTIPNPCEGIQQILIKVIYENDRGRGPVQSIEAYASPIFSFNYNASYLNRNDTLPTPEDGTIRPISMFNYNRGLWSDTQNVLVVKDYIFRHDSVWSPTTLLPTVTGFPNPHSRNIQLRRGDYGNGLVMSTTVITGTYV